MSKHRYRIPDLVQFELDSLEVDYDLEYRRKHIVVKISGERVTILPRGSGRGTGYAERNAAANIRRFVRNAAR